MCLKHWIALGLICLLVSCAVTSGKSESEISVQFFQNGKLIAGNNGSVSLQAKEFEIIVRSPANKILMANVSTTSANFDSLKITAELRKLFDNPFVSVAGEYGNVSKLLYVDEKAYEAFYWVDPTKNKCSELKAIENSIVCTKRVGQLVTNGNYVKLSSGSTLYMVVALAEKTARFSQAFVAANGYKLEFSDSGQ